MSKEKDYGFIIPSSETDRAKLAEQLKLIKAAKDRMRAEREYIRETLTETNELFPDIPKAMINKVTTDMSNDSFKKRSDKEDSYREFHNEITTIVIK